MGQHPVNIVYPIDGETYPKMDPLPAGAKVGVHRLQLRHDLHGRTADREVGRRRDVARLGEVLRRVQRAVRVEAPEGGSHVLGRVGLRKERGEVQDRLRRGRAPHLPLRDARLRFVKFGAISSSTSAFFIAGGRLPSRKL